MVSLIMSNVLRTMIALSYLVFVAVSPATAQGDDPFAITANDEAQMQQCFEAVRDLRTSGDKADQRDCIGVISDPCLDVAGNQTTLGMVGCIMREHHWWDARLNNVYGDLRIVLSGKTKSELRDIQRIWIRYKDAKCGFGQTFFEGGSMAKPIAADCLLRSTAERAIDLSQWIDMSN